MAEMVRRLTSDATELEQPELLKPEWLITNGLGGYASGTVAGPLTRRYHGLLVAALPTPLGRMVLLSHLWERARRVITPRMRRFGSFTPSTATWTSSATPPRSSIYCRR